MKPVSIGCVAACMLLCGAAVAAEVEGVKLADRIRVSDSGPELVLNGAGTRVTVNGEGKGTVPGEEFNRALLRVWLGEEPADAALKKAMLGG